LLAIQSLVLWKSGKAATPRPSDRDTGAGFIEFDRTVTTSGTQNIAGKGTGVHSHEYSAVPTSAANKRDVSLLVDLILECVKDEILSYSVGSFVEATRLTTDSVRIRIGIRSAMATSGMSCRRQIRLSCGTRAMVPSLFMNSQMTPEGWRPASLAKSTAASVLPGTCEYSASFARNGRRDQDGLDPKALSLD